MKVKYYAYMLGVDVGANLYSDANIFDGDSEYSYAPHEFGEVIRRNSEVENSLEAYVKSNLSDCHIENHLSDTFRKLCWKCRISECAIDNNARVFVTYYSRKQLDTSQLIELQKELEEQMSMIECYHMTDYPFHEQNFDSYVMVWDSYYGEVDHEENRECISWYLSVEDFDEEIQECGIEEMEFQLEHTLFDITIKDFKLHSDNYKVLSVECLEDLRIYLESKELDPSFINSFISNMDELLEEQEFLKTQAIAFLEKDDTVCDLVAFLSEDNKWVIPASGGINVMCIGAEDLVRNFIFNPTFKEGHR